MNLNASILSHSHGVELMISTVTTLKLVILRIMLITIFFTIDIVQVSRSFDPHHIMFL